ncbi:MAG: hypothetical protein K1Y36_29335 [Blastocatellia bacterium]|nr:hypothetical protein [Blastocatellia bacterium]
MPHGFTVMWAKDQCVKLQKAGEAGKPVTVLFGGIHQSAPSLKRAGIESGDVVFPLWVNQKNLYVLTGVVVEELIDLSAYAVNQLGMDPVEIEGRPEYAIKQLIGEKFGYLGHRSPYGCGIEVFLVERSTVLRFDNPVPGDQLSAIRFCPRKSPPAGLLHVDEGKLKSNVSLSGNIRRLCPETARSFARLVGLENSGL